MGGQVIYISGRSLAPHPGPIPGLCGQPRHVLRAATPRAARARVTLLLPWALYCTVKYLNVLAFTAMTNGLHSRCVNRTVMLT